MNRLDQGGSSGGAEKWSDSRYDSQVKQTGFVDGLDTECGGGVGKQSLGQSQDFRTEKVKLWSYHKMRLKKTPPRKTKFEDFCFEYVAFYMSVGFPSANAQ